jgi:outer membrane protein assembly factor BamE (lipoprotein component of BamABCDE complex)
MRANRRSVLASLFLAACASVASLPPGTSADDVERSMGRPFRVWQEAGGGASWEYPTGPEGKYTYMARMGPDRRLQRVDQVLDDPWFAKVQPGMSVEDIERLLGRPYSVVDFPLKQQTVWAWRYHHNVDDRCFYVYFDRAERVVTTGSRDEDREPVGPGMLAKPC